MTTVAFIGLGIMGGPMAGHLVAAGFDVVGYNRTQPKIDELVAAGGKGATSIADAVADADVVAVMVPDSPDVRAVLAGEGGVFDNARPGTLVIDFSSIRPDVTTELATQAKERGFRLLDAPVSGGEAGAKAATLSIMVGGAADDFQAAAQVLGAIGKTIVHVGPAGAGQTVKAANQLIVAGNIQLLAEAVAFVGFLLGRLPTVKRLLASQHRVGDAVHRLALASFTEQGLHYTKDHTGILFSCPSSNIASKFSPIAASTKRLSPALGMNVAKTQNGNSIRHRLRFLLQSD